jgi:hypothetical protein
MEENFIDIEGLDPAAVLAALYNSASPRGMGHLKYDPKPMTIQEAKQELVAKIAGTNLVPSFDYLRGRVMKISFRDDPKSFYVGLYNRDNGQGMAELVIKQLRETGSIEKIKVR